MKRLVLAVTTALLLALTGCDVGRLIHEPIPGTITDDDTIVVTGTVPNNTAAGGTIVVNGIEGTFTSERDWEAEIPTSPVGYVTVVTAIYTPPTGKALRQETAVVNGPGLGPGEYSPDGVGMRFTNAGLANLGPIINDLAGGSFDISGLILSQSPLIPPTSAGAGITITGTAYEAGVEAVSINASSTASGLSTPITISNLYLGLDLQLSGILSGPCKLEIQVPTVAIGTTFDFQPDPADPSRIDVNLIGSPNVALNGVSYEFISGVCDPSTPLLGAIINSAAGSSVQGSIRDGFTAQLRDPDGSGPADSPIAEAIETALAEVSVAGPVGDAVGARLNAPFTEINETSTGLDMRSDADFVTEHGTGPGQCVPAPGSPTLPQSFHVPGTYPTLGGTSPSGQPYGLGLVMSFSAFNQLLGSMTECGLLNQDVTEIDLNGAVLPVNKAVLSILVPEMATRPNGREHFIRVDPQFAPFLTGAAGAAGTTAEMMLADLRIEIWERTPSETGPVENRLFGIAVEAPLGIDMAFDPVAGELAPTITPPDPSDVTARVVHNGLNADEPATEELFAGVFPSFVGGIGDSFAAFPLPAFLGLDLEVVEMARQGTSFVLYANLNPVPATRIANVTVTDLSTGDYSDDDPVFDANEWRHRIRRQVGADAVRVDYKAVIGADACCFADDERADAHGGYRVTFNVVPAPGEAWRLDLAQTIRGAHTVLEEDLGSGWTSISTVTGRARIGTGAWQSFNMTPSSAGANNTNNRDQTDNRPFTGSAAQVLTGTTAQTITIEIGFDVTAYSDSTTSVIPPRFWAGDEAAVRIGANDSLANFFTAGGYPGVGNRNIVDDGQVLTIAVTPG